MTTRRFRIGDVFPATDEVARFLTVVAMMSNDWLRLMSAMIAIEDWHEDAEGLRVMSFRQQAALLYEAAVFLRDTPTRFPSVQQFLNGLEQSAQDARAQVVGGIDSTSEHYVGAWHENHRNVTFHYPRMHPDAAEHGAEEISEMLTQAAEIEGTITDDGVFGNVRFGFADDVVVQLLPDEETKDEIAKLRGVALSLGEFAQQAVGAYLAQRRNAYVVE